MRRGAKPAKSKVEAKSPVTRKSRKDEGSRVHDLEKRLAEALGQLEMRTRELDDVQEQQKATAEILGVISSSPRDVQPVFDAIAKNARHLLHGHSVSVTRLVGDELQLMSYNTTSPDADAVTRAFHPIHLERVPTAARTVREGTPAVVSDIETDPAATREQRDVARARGFRSFVYMPMVRDDVAIGVIAVTRQEPGGFTDGDLTLLKTFADQAVIAIENVRLFKELESSNRELRVALEQQTATSEILRVIAASPTDLQPVMNALAESAARLCEAVDAAIHRVEGNVLGIAANYVAIPGLAPLPVIPLPIDRTTVTGRAVIDRLPVHVHDLAEADGAEFPLGRESARRLGHRTTLAVPLLREGAAIGAILIRRREVNPFTDGQIALLQTFADQAVIAIENVRLFTELQTSNRDLTTALDTQTATSDILAVISRSQTDVQPVFDAIVASAVRLLGGYTGTMTRVVGDQLALGAFTFTSTDAAGATAVRASYPRPIHSAGTHGLAIRDRAPANIADGQTDPRLPENSRANARVLGFRSFVAVPLLRHGEAIGTIGVSRREPGGFTDDEIALLQTFADQAVIAIENVRLFTELQTSNRDLTTALDKQTATSDILRVISRSQTNVQPVFDTILDSAVRLLQANTGAVVTRIAGDQIELAAFTSTDDTSDAAVRAGYPLSLRSERPIAQAVRDRAPVNIADALTDPRVPEAVRAVARVRGWQSRVAVPLLRHEEAVGAISVTRREPGGFTDDEIALLQTFADQAVIAIENARLLTELQARTQELTRSVDQLTALGEVGQAVSSTLDLDTVLTTIVHRATELAGTDGGAIWEYDDATEQFRLRAEQGIAAGLVTAQREVGIRKGEGALGRVAVTREPIQIADIVQEGVYQSPLRGALLEAGIRSLLAVPLLREDRLVGGLVVNRKTPGEFPPETIRLLQTFATQSALAIQNARLFLEIADKSRQLEAASQHKSEFLANMSHELRTPLNAIIGFSEVLSEKMFGELNEKQEEYSKDIHASGQHLLSLINDILDLSKIEAGRMELELSDFHLPTALDSALTLVRERAGRRALTLHMSIDRQLGEIKADERKIRQVVLNLLSNAIKFTPEGGRIEVVAVSKDGLAEVSVSDTGVGIAPEDQEKVFEEFRQVGTADKKAEGTGLGLTLCRKFIELHGGKIRVKSAVGQGSTFTFTIPVRRGE